MKVEPEILLRLTFVKKASMPNTVKNLCISSATVQAAPDLLKAMSILSAATAGGTVKKSSQTTLKIRKDTTFHKIHRKHLCQRLCNHPVRIPEVSTQRCS